MQEEEGFGNAVENNYGFYLFLEMTAYQPHPVIEILMKKIKVLIYPSK